MKHISKQSEPQALTHWKRSGNQTWKPRYAEMKPAVKQQVKVALLTEQGSLCCYCEAQLDLDPKSSHIEHLEPQTHRPDLELDYSNMLCSCTTRGEHCGQKKGSILIEVHPLMPTVGEHFFFGTSGNIAPANDHPAQHRTATMIQTLGLNCEVLRSRRREAIGMALELIAGAPSASIQPLLRPRDGRYVAHVSAIAAALTRRNQ